MNSTLQACSVRLSVTHATQDVLVRNIVIFCVPIVCVWCFGTCYRDLASVRKTDCLPASVTAAPRPVNNDELRNHEVGPPCYVFLKKNAVGICV